MTKVTLAKAVVRPTTVSRRTARISPRKPVPLSRVNWILPSGESLAEFALRFGFLAPGLLGGKNVEARPRFWGFR